MAVVLHKQKKQPAMLTARIGEASYKLGDLRYFASAYIGSAQENTITIDNQAVEKRHILIYRRRTKLFIRNLSKKPITLNGNSLGAHKRSQLMLPVIITIADKINIHLFTRQVPVNNDGRKEQEKDAKQY